MARLIKRTTEPPKPIPPCSEEDTKTSLCEGTEEMSQVKSSPLLGWCINCECHAAHSWVDKLCYRCHNESLGLIFDDEEKRWVKSPEKKRKNNGM